MRLACAYMEGKSVDTVNAKELNTASSDMGSRSGLLTPADASLTVRLHMPECQALLSFLQTLQSETLLVPWQYQWKHRGETELAADPSFQGLDRAPTQGNLWVDAMSGGKL